MAKVGDYGTLVRFSLKNPDGSALDLTTSTGVVLRFRLPTGTIVDKTATITDASGGIASYSVEAGVFSVAGTWRVEARAAFPSSAWTSEEKTFEVDRAIPAP